MWIPGYCGADGIHKKQQHTRTVPYVQDWPNSLADWMRNSDELLMSRSTAILQIFQKDLLPAQGRGPLPPQSHPHSVVYLCIYFQQPGSEIIVNPLPGLRIRSISGRIRILQIRILKLDPDPGSYWHLKYQFKHLIFFLTSNIFLLIFE